LNNASAFPAESPRGIVQQDINGTIVDGTRQTRVRTSLERWWLWLKDIAPSLPLRRWFNRDPARWTEFKRRYAAELDTKKAAIAALAGAARRGRVTLLFGARDVRHNTAVVLQAYLTRHLAR
jgi:uncharacterized protein YeaO (DUF488 family)